MIEYELGDRIGRYTNEHWRLSLMQCLSACGNGEGSCSRFEVESAGYSDELNARVIEIGCCVLGAARKHEYVVYFPECAQIFQDFIDALASVFDVHLFSVRGDGEQRDTLVLTHDHDPLTRNMCIFSKGVKWCRI